MPNLRGTPRTVKAVLPLGTGSVTTQTRLVGLSEVTGRIKSIKVVGQGAVTATSLVAKVQKVSADGNTNTDLCTNLNIKLTTDTDETVLDATLSTTAGVLDVKKGTLFQAVVTADTCSAGPGDLLVVVEIEPRK
jgi:hypothetical protein